MVSLDKASKKEAKKENAKRRTTWNDYGNVNPVTKVIPDKKKEDNKKICRGKTDTDDE